MKRSEKCGNFEVGCIFVSIAFILIAVGANGCRTPNPIDLVSSGQPTTPVVQPPQDLTTSYVSLSDLDSTALFSPPQQIQLGQLLLEGAQYDAVTNSHTFVHHKGTVARAIFFDKTQPVPFQHDTAFKTIDLGSVSLDLIPLHKIPKLYGEEDSPEDSVLGTQYYLLSKDSIVDRGFNYIASHRYEWIVNSKHVQITSPPALDVVSPTPDVILHVSEDMPVRWNGGGDSITVYVRSVNGDMPSKIILNLTLHGNHGGAVIPKALLGLLPHDQTQFLFTFEYSVQQTTTIRGYPDSVFVQTNTSHTLLYQVRP
jgi:hypothetical protein